MKRRITMREIAKIARVNHATVSRALHFHPGIPETTRNRIVSIAKKAGYQPDPMLSALANYRKKTGQQPFVANLGYLIDCKETEIHGIYLDLFKGATDRATELGYKLNIVNTNEPGMNASRLTQILTARGIRGVFVAPLIKTLLKGSLELDWSRFAAVTNGHSLENPLLHTVCDDADFGMQEVLHQLKVRGYKRPGFVISEKHHERNNRQWLSAFLMAMESCEPSMRGPYLLSAHSTDRTGANTRAMNFERWWKALRRKPDALIFVDGTAELFLANTKWHIPEEMGVAILSKNSGSRNYSGVMVNNYKLGQTAISLLIGLMQTNEIGPPSQPHTIYVRGQWSEGKTLSITAK